MYSHDTETSVVGLISDGSEDAYRDEVCRLVEWCGDNNLSIIIKKTKELIIDYRHSGMSFSHLK